MIGPGIAVNILESQLALQLQGGRGSQNSVSVQNRGQILRRQKWLNDIGTIETVDAIRAKDSGLENNDNLF